jgi:signal transduction histidine kinase
VSDGTIERADDRPIDFRSAWLLGAVVAVVLGALRGAEQVFVRGAYAHPWLIVSVMSLASVIWLPVPALVERVLRADMTTRARWAILGMTGIVTSIVEPIWFFAVLARFAQWRPPGAYWINGALRLDTNLLIVAAITGWLWLREIGRRRETAADRASALRARASAAELDVLTMQLQPHFLFNTLNLVSQLAFESTARARRAIGNLRRLLEESVAPDRPATVTLGDELRFLDAYLDLQRDRFGARLDASVAADTDLLDARVPRMLLQPIVENAIRHGIAPRKSGGAVVVRARRAAGARVSIEITDDGVGLRGDDVREGMGLTNARHRLEQLYPGATLIALSARAGDVADGGVGGATSRVEFPLVTQPPTPTASSRVDDDVTDATAIDPANRTPARVRLTVMVLGWALVAAVWTELEAIVPMARNRPVPWVHLLSQNFLNVAVWIALTPLTLTLADRLSSRRRSGRIAAHAVGAFIFAAIHLAATSALFRGVLHADSEMIRGFQTSWAVWDLIAYAVLVAIGESIAARAKLHEQRAEAARAAARLAAARVALLRLNLQPSLLLSAIDAVDAAIDDPVRCESTITRLGDALRILLATGGGAHTTLRSELALLESYAAVVGQTAVVTLRDGVDLDAAIPAGVLVPLVSSMQRSALNGDVALHAERAALALTIHGDGARHLLEMPCRPGQPDRAPVITDEPRAIA